MHQIIKLEESCTVTVETRATGRARLSLAHAWFDMDRVDMTASQALALSRALLLAHDVLTGAETGAFVSNAGEGAQGGHPQRLEPDAGHCPEKKKPGGCRLHNVQCGYPACDRAKSMQAGRINWLAVAALGALAGFWAAAGMAIKTAIQAGAVVL